MWQADQGLLPQTIPELCIAEGLMPLDQPNDITPAWLANVLTLHGPIWAAGHYLDDPGHVIVITGIQGNVVHYNDPEGPPPRTMSFGILNNCRRRPDGLLVKDQTRY